MIELMNISFAYADIPALEEINLKIQDGESVALMGPNGSGKSTLLKLINGIICSDSGTYLFDGEVVTAKKLKDDKFAKKFHQKIGFIFQNPEQQLFCSSVYDEIAFGPRQMGLSENEVAQRVNDCLQLLELEAFRDRTPYHLSGGEKHKVAIASVLSLNPQVLVFDEPMNGLDPRSQRWLVSFMAQLHKSGKTLITSTHSLELVQEISQRAVLFDENHTIAADLPSGQVLEDIELLKRINLVDPCYQIK